MDVYSVSDFFKHLKGHLIVYYVGHLITILGPRDGNLPPIAKIQSVRCMHVWLRCKTFPVFHIIFENYLWGPVRGGLVIPYP